MIELLFSNHGSSHPITCLDLFIREMHVSLPPEWLSVEELEEAQMVEFLVEQLRGLYIAFFMQNVDFETVGCV